MNIGTVRTFGNGAAQGPVVILLAPKLAKLAERENVAHKGAGDGDDSGHHPDGFPRGSGFAKDWRLPANCCISGLVRLGARQPVEERHWFWPVKARPPSKGNTHGQ